MKTKPNSYESHLYKLVDQILFEKWDPIEITNSGDLKDEYKSYVPSIYNLLIQNASVEKISEQLEHHVTVNMGLSPQKEHSLKIAKLLVKTKSELK